MSYVRERAISVTSALVNLPKPHDLRRSNSTPTSLTTRSLRVVVLGVGGVGKTAMSVRFVTNRFIGDYDPTLETIYRHTALIDGEIVNFEIMDTAGQEDQSIMLEDKCKWGESFIILYDVTDQCSFDELTRFKFVVSYTHNRMRVNFEPCLAIVGNKLDLAATDRIVDAKEGRQLARDLGCHIFREISVKESVSDASNVFEDLWREFSSRSPRSPSSSHRKKSQYRLHKKIPILNSSKITGSFDNDIMRTMNKPTVASSTQTATIPRRCQSFNNVNKKRMEECDCKTNSKLNFRTDVCDCTENGGGLFKSATKLSNPNNGKRKLNRNLSTTALYRRRQGICSRLSADDVFQTRKTSSSSTLSLSSTSSSSVTSLNDIAEENNGNDNLG